ncbi:MAG: hypothetical protein A2428_06090 [Bdellovibrionales bacterium RIFOXYC1_FULL_54_43]|nr:MAG: hypothetical protein A2428_06090 [Bdellovibrionales bacterium RIFOXYC1_FULL_54_43]OFZ84823.1 MAG: hypothetical protein A2603_02870 [Bdellovibrionales bacterium RIFOXYD1_FULL_55_31]
MNSGTRRTFPKLPEIRKTSQVFDGTGAAPEGAPLLFRFFSFFPKDLRRSSDPLLGSRISPGQDGLLKKK